MRKRLQHAKRVVRVLRGPQEAVGVVGEGLRPEPRGVVRGPVPDCYYGLLNSHLFVLALQERGERGKGNGRGLTPSGMYRPSMCAPPGGT